MSEIICKRVNNQNVENLSTDELDILNISKDLMEVIISKETFFSKTNMNVQQVISILSNAVISFTVSAALRFSDHAEDGHEVKFIELCQDGINFGIDKIIQMKKDEAH